MASNYRFDSVEHFTSGTVGPKGQRTFFLQFGVSGSMVTLKVEKQQVAALAEYLDELMDEVETPTYDAVPLALDLIEPIVPEWVVGSIGAAYHEERDRFIIIVEEFLDEDDESDPGSAQITLTRGQVVAFVERSRQEVSSGRPPCAYCGRPLDHDDGWCPCFN